MLRGMLALVLSGVLVTLQGGNEIAREQWRNDGKVVTSDVTIAGQKARFTIDRHSRAMKIEKDGQTIDVPVAAGAAPLPNLDWAVYGLYADWYKDAHAPTTFTAVIAPGVTRQASLTVTPAAAGGKKVMITLGPTTVEAEVDAHGAVTHATVPSQQLEVKPIAPGAATVRAPAVHRAVPADVVEAPFELDNGKAKLAGVVWRPKAAKGPVPVVIVIAGSGPVDRDGNAGALLDTDAYRQLAAALAGHGIATLRYDKRGIGASTMGKPLDQIGFDDFVSDAVALVALARHDPKLSKVYLFGHSEGSLIALEAAARTHVDGIISAAGAGRRVGDVAREQFARQIPAAEMAEYDQLLAAVRAGKPLHARSEHLAVLFQPSLAKFLRGMLLTDPKPLARAYKGPLTVVQGDNDNNVSVARDAKPLAAAHPGARLLVLHDVTHALKVDKTQGLAQPSEHDPSLPLAPGVVDAVVSTVR
jgi:pimeloyl-ACP methyl ester carboxylesterase